jgi:hypothetical protein
LKQNKAILKYICGKPVKNSRALVQKKELERVESASILHFGRTLGILIHPGLSILNR